SPQLLMCSGVGSADTLSKFGIPVLHDAPEVGENLQDHPMSPFILRAKGTNMFKDAETFPSVLRYLLRKRGMLASNAAEAIAFANSRGVPGEAPDIELIFAAMEWLNQGLELPQMHAF